MGLVTETECDGINPRSKIQDSTFPLKNTGNYTKNMGLVTETECDGINPSSKIKQEPQKFPPCITSTDQQYLTDHHSITLYPVSVKTY